MAILQNSARSNNVVTNFLPDVSNINTSDYNLSQVNSYINNSIEQMSGSLNNLKNNRCITTVAKTVTVTAGDFIEFNKSVYDPVGASSNSSFVSPVDGIVQINLLLNLSRTSGSSTTINLYVGSDVKSALYSTTDSDFIVQSSIALDLTQGDVVRISCTSDVQINQTSLYYNQFFAGW